MYFCTMSYNVSYTLSEYRYLVIKAHTATTLSLQEPRLAHTERCNNFLYIKRSIPAFIVSSGPVPSVGVGPVSGIQSMLSDVSCAMPQSSDPSGWSPKVHVQGRADTSGFEYLYSGISESKIKK